MGGGASDHNRHTLLQSDGPMWKVTYPPLKLTSSCQVRGWHSLGIGICHAQDRCTSPTPCKPTSTGGEARMMPQESSGSAVTQHPASKTSLGWINGSYDFYHGHPLEHPLKMGEDLR